MTFTVERDRLVAYAEATNDPTHSGDIAPPVFAAVPAFDAVYAAIVAAVPAEALGHLVHLDQDFRFHRPVVPGDVLDSNARVVGVQSGRAGTQLAVLAETSGADGTPVCEQYFSVFFRGIDLAETTGELAPSHRLPAAVRSTEPVGSVVITVDEDQPKRYAEASGDHNPIHLDDAFARSVGLPGVIVHGLCTQAMTAWAVCQSVTRPARRLSRHAVRFARPVLPGQALTVTTWQAGEDAYAFEATADGTTVIKDGLAEFR